MWEFKWQILIYKISLLRIHNRLDDKIKCLMEMILYNIFLTDRNSSIKLSLVDTNKCEFCLCILNSNAIMIFILSHLTPELKNLLKTMKKWFNLNYFF